MTVPRFSLSDFAPADVLKIDVEGAEHDLLDQEPEAWQGFRYVLAESHGDQAARDRFADRLVDLGFDVVRKQGDGVDQVAARR